jgi:AcrR family transcriptional regulator
MPRSPAAAPAAKPLKRPSQARARFTVQAIYDAFVRIWQRDGWAQLTTRAVALETGVSVGTLYDYFPNKQALLSGYVRHAMEQLLARLQQHDGAAATWQQRVERLVLLTCGADGEGLAYFDREMLQLESQIAEPKHHRRVYEELVAAWQAALARCTDLPQRPSDDAVRALVIAVWGGRRYLMLVQPRDIQLAEWTQQMQRLCIAALSAAP